MKLLGWLRGKLGRKAAEPASRSGATVSGPPPVPREVESRTQGIDDLEPLEHPWPERPLLYMFQHVALREAVFENHPELIRELEDGASILPLLHFRSRARLRCEVAGWTEDDGLDDDVMQSEEELFSAVRIHSYRRDGHTVHLVTMPAPEFSPEAYFVAIVHRDDEPRDYMRDSPSTRYLTLEKSENSERPVLCEWLRDGSHVHYGEGPVPEMEAFVEAVFERVSSQTV